MNNLSILVVGAEPLYRNLLSRYLKQRYAGHDVAILVAASAIEATEIVRDRGVSLVLSDISLAPSGGRSFYDALKQENREIEVIFLSGDSSLNESVAERGAYYLQWKPFNSLEEIGAVSDEALAKHGLMIDRKYPEVKVDGEKSAVSDIRDALLKKMASLKKLSSDLEEKQSDDPSSSEIVSRIHNDLDEFGGLVNELLQITNAPVTDKGVQAEDLVAIRQIMGEVSTVFAGLLFNNHLTVDVNMTPNIEVSKGRGDKLKIIFVSIISYLVKVLDDCHLIIFVDENSETLNIRCEVYVVEDGGGLDRIIDSGTYDAKRMLKEIDGVMRVTEITDHQVNIELLIPNR